MPSPPHKSCKGLSSWQQQKREQRCASLWGHGAAGSLTLVKPGAQIEKDEDYIRTVVMLGARLEPVIKANNAIDVYEEYFPNKPLEPGSDAPGQSRRSRSMTSSACICWRAHVHERTACSRCCSCMQDPCTKAVSSHTPCASLKLDRTHVKRCAGLATATVLRDAASAGRAAQYLCWHPDQSRRLAVAHATMVPPR